MPNCPYLIVVLLAVVQDDAGHQGEQAELKNEGLQVQCDQCRETNIGDRSYERTKLKLKNRALWVAREFHEVFPMMIFVCQVFRLCEKMAIARSHCIGSIWCIK